MEFIRLHLTYVTWDPHVILSHLLLLPFPYLSGFHPYHWPCQPYPLLSSDLPILRSLSTLTTVSTTVATIARTQPHPASLIPNLAHLHVGTEATRMVCSPAPIELSLRRGKARPPTPVGVCRGAGRPPPNHSSLAAEAACGNGRKRRR